MPIAVFPKKYAADGAVAACTANDEKTDSMPIIKRAVMDRAAGFASFLVFIR